MKTACDAAAAAAAAIAVVIAASLYFDKPRPAAAQPEVGVALHVALNSTESINGADISLALPAGVDLAGAKRNAAGRELAWRQDLAAGRTENTVGLVAFAKGDHRVAMAMAILALSGGHATECANVFSKAGFTVPALAQETYKRILEHFEIVGSTYANPIEGRTLSNPDNMNNVLDALNDDPNDPGSCFATERCRAIDTDLNCHVTIDEILAAVTRALDGCEGGGST